MKYLNYNVIISLIITLLLTYFLLSQIDFSDIFGLFDEINYFYIFASFILYFTLTFIRALRIKSLVDNKIGIKNLFAIVLVNNLVINLLPFRIGELSLPVLLKKYSGIEKKEGFLLLFYLRIMDIIVVMLLFLTVILLFSSSVVYLTDVLYIFALFLLLFALVALFKSDKILSVISDFAKKESRYGFFKKVSVSIDRLLPIYKFYKNKMGETIVLSVLIFIILIFVFGFVLKAYPISLSCTDIIIISLITTTITSLPINGVAGIGTIELGISSFLMSLGISKNLSVGIAFNYHFIYLIFIVFFGSLGFIYLHYKKKKQLCN